jgi:hypothetical protein
MSLFLEGKIPSSPVISAFNDLFHPSSHSLDDEKENLKEISLKRGEIVGMQDALENTKSN